MVGTPFEAFPWFRRATIDELTDVEWPTGDHLYWPQLDVHLSVESIRDPSAFPLVSRVSGPTAHPAAERPAPPGTRG